MDHADTMTRFIPYDCTVTVYRADFLAWSMYAEDAFPLRVFGPANPTADQMQEIADRASAKARRIVSQHAGFEPCMVGVRIGQGEAAS